MCIVLYWNMCVYANVGRREFFFFFASISFDLKQESGGKGRDGVAGDLGQGESRSRELLGRASNVDVGVGDLIELLLIETELVDARGDGHESHGVLVSTGGGARGLVVGLDNILGGGARGDVGVVLAAEGRDLEGVAENVAAGLDTGADIGLAGGTVVEGDAIRTVGADSVT